MKTVSLLSATIIFFFFSTDFKEVKFSKNPFGGFQLLMTKEQNDRMKRIMYDLESDFEALQNKLDMTLYVQVDGRTTRKENINLTDNITHVVITLTQRLASDFEDLRLSMDKVYFSTEIDHHYKNYFRDIKSYHKYLEFFTGQNVQNEDILFELFAKGKKSESDIAKIKNAVEDAYIATKDEMKRKIDEMSVWEWLFGS